MYLINLALPIPRRLLTASKVILSLRGVLRKGSKSIEAALRPTQPFFLGNTLTTLP
jgi:hypothetical protein